MSYNNSKRLTDAEKEIIIEKALKIEGGLVAMAQALVSAVGTRPKTEEEILNENPSL